MEKWTTERAALENDIEFLRTLAGQLEPYMPLLGKQGEQALAYFRQTVKNMEGLLSALARDAKSGGGLSREMATEAALMFSQIQSLIGRTSTDPQAGRYRGSMIAAGLRLSDLEKLLLGPEPLGLVCGDENGGKR